MGFKDSYRLGVLRGRLAESTRQFRRLVESMSPDNFSEVQTRLDVLRRQQDGLLDDWLDLERERH